MINNHNYLREKDNIAMIGVLTSLLLSVFSFIGSMEVFFAEFFIHLLLSFVVILMIFAYTNNREYFQNLILMYCSFSIINILYVYLYNPVWILVPNFILLLVIFIKYSFFKKTELNLLSRYNVYKPRLKVEYININQNVKEEKAGHLKRFLSRLKNKLKRNIKVLKYSVNSKQIENRTNISSNKNNDKDSKNALNKKNNENTYRESKEKRSENKNENEIDNKSVKILSSKEKNNIRQQLIIENQINEILGNKEKKENLKKENPNKENSKKNKSKKKLSVNKRIIKKETTSNKSKKSNSKKKSTKVLKRN